MTTTRFSKRMRCTVKVLRDGGRDRYGQNRPEVAHEVRDCLVGPMSTKDLVDMSDQPREAATLYGPVRMDIASTDRVVVPRTHPMAGVYRVNGRPGYWPMGTTVPLLWVKPLDGADG